MLTAKEGLARADFSVILMPMLGGDRLFGLPSYPDPEPNSACGIML